MRKREALACLVACPAPHEKWEAADLDTMSSIYLNSVDSSCLTVIPWACNHSWFLFQLLLCTKGIIVVAMIRIACPPDSRNVLIP